MWEVGIWNAYQNPLLSLKPSVPFPIVSSSEVLPLFPLWSAGDTAAEEGGSVMEGNFFLATKKRFVSIRKPEDFLNWVGLSSGLGSSLIGDDTNEGYMTPDCSITRTGWQLILLFKGIKIVTQGIL